MEIAGQLLVVLLMSLLALAKAVDVRCTKRIESKCKFSNEGCDSDEECCSGRCFQAHPGTNPRCTRSTLHHPCLYSYHCDHRLSCGRNKTCCSKYWGTCINDCDCCNPRFVCIEADGFYYKRCLMGSLGAGSQRVKAASVLATSLLVLLTAMLVRFVTTDTYDVIS